MNGESKKIYVQKRISLWLSNRGFYSRIAVIALIFLLLVTALVGLKMREIDIGALEGSGSGDEIPATARLIVEGNRDFLVFYVVLFFTCVVGIIELLSEFDNVDRKFSKKGDDEKIALTLLYLFLVAGIFFSISQCWNVYRISYALTYNGKLGNDLMNFAKENPSFVDILEKNYGFLTNIYWEIGVLTFNLTYFICLYLARLGYLVKRKDDQTAKSNESA